MNVWIFQTGEPLHIDGNHVRGMRAMNLADSLLSNGHSVTIWTSSFVHYEKKHRSKSFKKISVGKNLKICLVPSLGYEKHIGFRRLLDHFQLAYNLRKQLKKEKVVPDVAFVGYPPVEFAYIASAWLKHKGIPFMLDAKDQWPHIFLDPVPKTLRPLARIMFAPYFYLGQMAMRNASSFCSMTQSFLNWMEEFSGRRLSDKDCVIPLSPLADSISLEDRSVAEKWWAECGVTQSEKKRFFFVGSFSRAFDFAPIAEAAKIADKIGLGWQFVLCGDGDQAVNVYEMFKQSPNVVLPGWVDRSKVVVLAEMSTLGLAPYQNNSNFSNNIPNKIIDYLSLGTPIVTPLSGEVSKLISKANVGGIYKVNDGKALFDVLSLVSSDKDEITVKRNNALNLYKLHFVGTKVYSRLVKKLVELGNGS